MGKEFIDCLNEEFDRGSKKNGEPTFQFGASKAELLERFNKLRYLQDSTAKNRYAKTATIGNPLGGLWS